MDLPDEIKFMQQNTVDKYSDLRSNDSGDSDREDSHSHDHDHLPHTDHPDQMLAEPPVIRNAGNTGVKGVLAEYLSIYAEAKENLRIRTQMEKAETQRMIERMAITVGNGSHPYSQSSNNVFDEDDEDDDEFMRQYRLKRLAELQQNSRPTFGYLRSIDSSEYVDAIEKEHKDVFVVVHLYKNHFRECVKLNLILQNLAIKYPFVKFMKIVSTEAKPDYDDLGLPSLLVYQGGDVQYCWVPVTTKIGKNFEPEDVEILLAKYKIIKNVQIDKTNMLHKEKNKELLKELDDDYSASEDDD